LSSRVDWLGDGVGRYWFSDAWVVIGDELEGRAVMMWYGGDGWGWCGVILNVLATVVFLGVVIAAAVLAVRVPGDRRSDPSARGDNGFARAGPVVAPPGARGDTGEDDFYRRLM
jgi:hypothetical protein